MNAKDICRKLLDDHGVTVTQDNEYDVTFEARDGSNHIGISLRRHPNNNDRMTCRLTNTKSNASTPAAVQWADVAYQNPPVVTVSGAVTKEMFIRVARLLSLVPAG